MSLVETAWRARPGFVVVDSSVWIDYLKGAETAQTVWLDGNLERRRVVLTDLNLCEVLQGYQDERVFSRVRQSLARFQVFSTGGEALAIRAAQNYRFLKGKGVSVRGTIDCLIATFCMERQYELLHRDRDFDAFEKHLGLRVVHPPALAVQ